MSHQGLAACLLLSLSINNLSAQQFADTRRQQPSLRVMPTFAVAAVDLNGDRLLDIVTMGGGGRFGDTQVALLSQGDGSFSPSMIRGTTPSSVQVVAHLDMDGDGDVDLIHARTALLNDGRGRFTTKALTGFNDVGSAPGAVGDLNGDGMLDVVIGHRIHRRTAIWAFAAPVVLSATAGYAATPKLVDVDNDKDLDVVFSVPKGRTELWVNDGKGKFTNRTATHMPAAKADTRDVVAIDFDGDGDQDLMLADPRPSYFQNDGKGKFTDLSSTVFAGVATSETFAIAAADLDGDTDIDVVVGHAFGARVLENRSGRMVEVGAKWGGGKTGVNALAVADFDKDGDLDLYAARFVMGAQWSHDAEDDVALNDGKGNFLQPRQAPIAIPSTGRHVAVGRLDKDAHVDLFSAEAGCRVAMGDGRGQFRKTTTLNLNLKGRPLLRDLDGDRDLDAVVVGARAFYVLENPGNGLLRLVNTYPFTSFPTSSSAADGVLADFNGDGILDLFVATHVPSSYWPGNERDQLWAGTGQLKFRDVTSAIPGKTKSFYAVAGDVDKDGDLDVVGDGGQIYLNNSTRSAFRFTARAFQIRRNWGSSAVALGDMDGDGDLDLVAGNACRGTGCQPNGEAPMNVLHWNDGKGGFQSYTWLPTSLTQTVATALADFDEDGDLDIVFGQRLGGHLANLFVRNDGKAKFSHVAMRERQDSTAQVFATDVDGDTDLDLVVVNESRDRTKTDPVSRVVVNLMRQVQAPLVPRIGQTYVLASYGAVGPRVLAVSVAPAAIATPLGVLGVDLRVAALLGPFAANQSLHTTRAVIPRSATLVGVRFYVQAALNSGGRVRLTNTLAEQISGH